MKRVELGDRVKDNVTGFTGIATARCEYLNGCDHIGIQPQVGPDGKIPKLEWIDEPQVNVIMKNPNLKKSGRKKGKGGPSVHPGGRAHPSNGPDSYVEPDSDSRD